MRTDSSPGGQNRQKGIRLPRSSNVRAPDEHSPFTGDISGDFTDHARNSCQLCRREMSG